MLFQRNEMPAEHPPDFAFSICFPIEIDRNRCAADQPPGFSISMILLMLFHRNFVSTDFKQAPMGISFLEGTIRPLGCADFVDFLTVFNEMSQNPQPGFAASRFGHFVDIPNGFPSN